MAKLIDVDCCLRMVKTLISYGMKEEKAITLVASSYCNIVSFKTLSKLYFKEFH